MSAPRTAAGVLPAAIAVFRRELLARVADARGRELALPLRLRRSRPRRLRRGPDAPLPGGQAHRERRSPLDRPLFLRDDGPFAHVRPRGGRGDRRGPSAVGAAAGGSPRKAPRERGAARRGDRLHRAALRRPHGLRDQGSGALRRPSLCSGRSGSLRPPRSRRRSSRRRAPRARFSRCSRSRSSCRLSSAPCSRRGSRPRRRNSRRDSISRACSWLTTASSRRPPSCSSTPSGGSDPWLKAAPRGILELATRVHSSSGWCAPGGRLLELILRSGEDRGVLTSKTRVLDSAVSPRVRHNPWKVMTVETRTERSIRILLASRFEHLGASAENTDLRGGATRFTTPMVSMKGVQGLKDYVASNEGVPVRIIGGDSAAATDSFPVSRSASRQVRTAGLLGLARSSPRSLLAPRAGARASAASSPRASSRSRTRSSRASTSARAATSRAARSPPQVPRVPQARRRAHQGEERRPPDVTGKECAGCHVEHAGLDGDLRHFEPKGFDHKGETGFALDGLHAPLECKACHKTRSYLGLSAACASCHKDVHNGALGATCQTCHPTSVAFKDTRKGFDHMQDEVPADRRAREDALRELPQDEGRVPDRALLGLRGLPQEPPPAGARDVHDLPRHGELQDARRGPEVRPREDRLPAPRPARDRRLPDLPREADDARAAQVHALRRLPPGRAQGPVPRRGLRGLPHGDRASSPRSSTTGAHEVRPRRQARDHRVRRLPQGGGDAGTQFPSRSASVDFRGAKKECASCHADVHKGKLGPTCQTCHGTAPSRSRSSSIRASPSSSGRARGRRVREVPPSGAGARGRAP